MHESRYVSTALVSKALGVSVTTVKRWVDEGHLPAHKTVGGHRKILLCDVLRLIRAKKLPYVDLQLLTGAAVPEPPTAAELDERLFRAVEAGDADAARSLLVDAYRAGMPIEKLGDRVVAPTMARVGHCWESGTIDVLHEHRATQVCLAALHAVREQFVAAPADAARPVAVGGCVEGDHYRLATLLAQMALADRGWEAIDIGPNTPVASFRRALVELRPRLLWISFSHLADPERFVAEYTALRREASKRGVAVVLGGQALTAELRGRLRADLHGDSFSRLVEFAEELVPRRPSAHRRRDDA